MPNSSFSLISGVLLWVASGPESAQANDAHVHGIGHMNVAIEGSRLEIEVTGPGDNFVGYEHAAQTALQRAALAAAERQLRRPSPLLVVPKAAGCTLRELDLNVPAAASAAAGKGHDHGKHDHDHAAADSHGDWSAHYVFACTDPTALASIRTAPWFAAFPNTKELRVQVISGFGQSGLTLTPARSRILLRTR